MIKNKAKILLFDIETAPNLGYVWGKWEQDVIEFDRQWYMLCFCAKWLGDKKVMTHALPDFSLYKKDPENDKELVKKLWELFNEADIIIAHNGDEFDIKKSNARFIYHGFTPNPHYKTIDTKKIAKKYFSFESNKLDDLGQYLKVGKKLSTGGFALWRGCMAGDKKSWKTMVEYNKQDVVLLEHVYLRLRPWMKDHPNLNVINLTLSACPACGSEDLHKRGFSITRSGQKQRYQCQDCGMWSQGKSEAIKDLVIR